MRRRFHAVILVGAVAACTAAVAHGNVSMEANLGAASKADAAGGIAPSAVGDTCGKASIAGPPTSESTNVVVENLVADQLTHVIVDSYPALGGASFRHQNIVQAVAPPSGTVVKEYPADITGEGPAVLEFTGFDLNETATFFLDPDTYDSSSYPATVAEMVGTKVEFVYAATARRCSGVMKARPSGATVATLKQDSPAPAAVTAAGVGANAVGENCGTAKIPTSSATTITFKNQVADPLITVIVDSYAALNGSSLVLQTASVSQVPTGGSGASDYPTDPTGEGPAVFLFTDFGLKETAIVQLDPDTYSNPDYGSERSDMIGTRVEFIYDPFGTDRRCSGTMGLKPSGAVFAKLKQDSPTP